MASNCSNNVLIAPALVSFLPEQPQIVRASGTRSSNPSPRNRITTEVIDEKFGAFIGKIVSLPGARRTAKRTLDFNNSVSKKEWCEGAFVTKTFGWSPLFEVASECSAGSIAAMPRIRELVGAASRATTSALSRHPNSCFKLS